jgi:hypothetical protein
VIEFNQVRLLVSIVETDQPATETPEIGVGWRSSSFLCVGSWNEMARPSSCSRFYLLARSAFFVVYRSQYTWSCPNQSRPKRRKPPSSNPSRNLWKMGS